MHCKSFGSLVASFVAVCVSLLSVLACATNTPDSTSSERPMTGLDSLGAEIDRRILDSQASDIGSCRLIALGSKPCGGPWRYLGYSSEVVDSVELASMVSEYNELEAKLNREEERASDCTMVQRPRIVWKDGHCDTDP